MSISIISGAGTDVLTVDPTSKAGRVTPYDSLGAEINAAPIGCYCLPIRIVQSAASVAGVTVWAMRLVNTSTKKVKIKKIHLAIGFAGGTATVTVSEYDLVRFSAATPTLGTAITVVKKKSSYGASDVTDARFLDTGLTTTGITFETAFAMVGCGRNLGAVQNFGVDFSSGGGNRDFEAFELRAGEGFAIRLGIVAVIGDYIEGFVTWDEV